jgi:hypothetical protein
MAREASKDGERNEMGYLAFRRHKNMVLSIGESTERGTVKMGYG